MHRFLVFLIVAGALFSSCNGTAKKESDKVTVAVSIEPQRYFVEQIAGDKVNVMTLVPNGARPETYDLTPSQLVDLSNCDAYFMMGSIEFERQWADTYINDHPHTNIFVMSEGIKPIISDHRHCGESVKTDSHSFVEPHMWLSVNNALHMANNTLSGLLALDPENREYYQSRYDSVSSELLSLNNKFEEFLEHADSAFMIYHPALSYFARDYGLVQISIESDGKEPSPGQLKAIIEEARSMGVKVIFIQPEFDPRSAEVVAEETKTRLVKFNPLSYDWEKEMTDVVKALSNNVEHDNE